MDKKRENFVQRVEKERLYSQLLTDPVYKKIREDLFLSQLKLRKPEDNNQLTLFPENKGIESSLFEKYDLTKFEDQLQYILDEVRDKLLEKNRKYGNSLHNSPKIFHKGSTIQGINAILDHKLARVSNQNEDEDEDVEFDILGYLVHKQLHKKFY